MCIEDKHLEDIINFLTTRIAPERYSFQQKKEIVVRTTDFFVIEGNLYKMGNDEIL